MLMVGLLASALGELFGYLAGHGNAKPRLAGFEFHRVRHLGTYDAGISISGRTR